MIKHLYLRIDKDGVTRHHRPPRVFHPPSIETFVHQHEATIAKRLSTYRSTRTLGIEFDSNLRQVAPLVVDPAIKRPLWLRTAFEMPVITDFSQRLRMLETFYQELVVQKTKQLFERWKPNFSAFALDGLQFNRREPNRNMAAAHRRKPNHSTLQRPRTFSRPLFGSDSRPRIGPSLEFAGHGDVFYSVCSR
ncbi:MAG: hypothetical protein MZU97_00175 [Bacillus subtilis]|nr:hypothetical protein [Bacillus subtilis]